MPPWFFEDCYASLDDGHADHIHSCADLMRHGGDHACGCGEEWADTRGAS